MEILSVKNLTFGYLDCPVFKDFSLQIEQGHIYLIDGENGVGKTTLLKCMTSILNNGKNIFYEGTPIENNKYLLKNIAYVMSEDTLYPYMTVDENISFYKNLFSEGKEFTDKVYNILNKLNCRNYKDFLVKNLSQGTRNKIYLAIMFSKNARVLILDEPFTALDKDSQKFFLELIKQQNNKNKITIIMVTHISEFKIIASKVVHVEKRDLNV